MRNAGRDNNEAARRIAFQLGRIKLLALAQIPGPFDNRYHFVMRVRVRENTSATGYLHPIYPRAAPTGITEQPRPLPPILVVGRREPLHLFRSKSKNRSADLVVSRPC